MKTILTIAAICFGLNAYAQNSTDQAADISAINSVLDGYHQAAAEGNWDVYFSLMSDDGVFLGTDAKERWTKPEFESYASTRSGWVYSPMQRHINITPDGMSAWFDELLDSQSYGTSRGTGVLIRTPNGWLISQYHLTLPIPNALARPITDQIKQFESTQ